MEELYREAKSQNYTEKPAPGIFYSRRGFCRSPFLRFVVEAPNEGNRIINNNTDFLKQELGTGS